MSKHISWSGTHPSLAILAEVAQERDEWQARAEAAELDLAAAQSAAHMPADYPHGLPSWINQHLYAAYIGARFSDSVMEQIRNGRLAFPEAPVYTELAATLARITELEAQLAAQAWRPVTEPPTENGDYLAYSWPGECEVLSFNDGYWSFVPVTHWQPLPAPPIDTPARPNPSEGE